MALLGRYYSAAYYSEICRIFGTQQNNRFRQIAKIWVSVVLYAIERKKGLNGDLLFPIFGSCSPSPRSSRDEKDRYRCWPWKKIHRYLTFLAPFQWADNLCRSGCVQHKRMKICDGTVHNRSVYIQTVDFYCSSMPPWIPWDRVKSTLKNMSLNHQHLNSENYSCLNNRLATRPIHTH